MSRFVMVANHIVFQDCIGLNKTQGVAGDGNRCGYDSMLHLKWESVPKVTQRNLKTVTRSRYIR